MDIYGTPGSQTNRLRFTVFLRTSVVLIGIALLLYMLPSLTGVTLPAWVLHLEGWLLQIGLALIAASVYGFILTTALGAEAYRMPRFLRKYDHTVEAELAAAKDLLTYAGPGVAVFGYPQPRNRRYKKPSPIVVTFDSDGILFMLHLFGGYENRTWDPKKPLPAPPSLDARPPQFEPTIFNPYIQVMVMPSGFPLVEPDITGGVTHAVAYCSSEDLPRVINGYRSDDPSQVEPLKALARNRGLKLTASSRANQEGAPATEPGIRTIGKPGGRAKRSRFFIDMIWFCVKLALLFAVVPPAVKGLTDWTTATGISRVIVLPTIFILLLALVMCLRLLRGWLLGPTLTKHRNDNGFEEHVAMTTAQYSAPGGSHNNVGVAIFGFPRRRGSLERNPAPVVVALEDGGPLFFLHRGGWRNVGGDAWSADKELPEFPSLASFPPADSCDYVQVMVMSPGFPFTVLDFYEDRPRRFYASMADMDLVFEACRDYPPQFDAMKRLLTTANYRADAPWFRIVNEDE